MVLFLGIVAVIAYLISAATFAIALTASDIQLILSGVFATCGTVAAGCAAIISHLKSVANEIRVAPQQGSQSA